MIRKSKSKRDKPVLHIGGHVYHLNRVSSKGASYWRCVSFPRCRGTAVEEQGRSPVGRQVHTCQSNPELSRIREIEAEMKENAQQQLTVKSKTVYEQSLEQARVEGLDHLLKPYESISNTLHRRRRRLIPTAAQSAIDLDIPVVFRTLQNGDEFLQLDVRYVGADGTEKRLLAFGSTLGLRRLAVSSIWCYDGTFQLCPMQFAQLFILHGAIGSTFYPCLYCFMPQRDRAAYNALVTGLLDLAATNELQLFPQSIISDFEAASHSVFSQIFRARMVGCLFHYAQSLYRWFIQNHLASLYEAYASLRRMYRSMVALALLPHEMIENTFNHYMSFFRAEALHDLRHSGFDVDSMLNAFEAYYRRQWIRITEWLSVFGCPFRTNNSCEAFHSSMESKIDAHKPSFYKMLEFLKTSEENTASRLNQMIHGTATTTRRTKYMIIDEKIDFLSRQLADGVIDPVLFVDSVGLFLGHIRHGG